MSKNKKLSVANSRYKRRGQLAVAPTPSAYQAKRTKLLDDKRNDMDKVNSLGGRKSYSQIAKTQGLYISICSAIRWFKQNNQDCTFKSLYVYLHSQFPTVFEKEDMHESNFAKIISGDTGWSQAYFSRSLLELAEQRMSEVLNADYLDDNTKMVAYDKVWKVELAKRQLDAEQSVENKDNKVELNVNISVEDDDE